MQTTPSPTNDININVSSFPAKDLPALPAVSRTQQAAMELAQQRQAAQAAAPAPSFGKSPDLEIAASEKLVINLEKEQITSVLSRAAHMQGNITTSEGYRVDGTLEGDLTAGTTIIITEGAKVIGKVTAPRVIVQGTVEGGIECNGSLIVTKSATIMGETFYKSIVTYQGSTIEGTLRKIRD